MRSVSFCGGPFVLYFHREVVLALSLHKRMVAHLITYLNISLLHLTHEIPLSREPAFLDLARFVRVIQGECAVVE